MPALITPILNMRQAETTPVLTTSPKKQINFNIKYPTNIYIQPTTSISSTQPIRSTLYNNILNLQV